MRFLADRMLERLARWLRVLDVDVVSAPADASDAALVRRAIDEGRVVLTRDRGEVFARGPTMIVQSGAPLEQLREVVDRFGIAVPPELFARCLLCNAPLGDAVDVAQRRCPECGRVYWEGSHTRRMRAALARTLDAPARNGTGGP